MRALQSSEHDPEQAYLHLITAGEIISEAQYPAGGRLLDPDLEAVLQRIEKDLPDGKAAASTLRKRLFEIKRRFVTTFMDYIDQPFFEGGEAEAAFWCFQPDTVQGVHRRGLRPPKPLRPHRAILRRLGRAQPPAQ
ncbi:hypothetical protein ACRAWD_05250 [Caulobacter segnis]